MVGVLLEECKFWMFFKYFQCYCETHCSKGRHWNPHFSQWKTLYVFNMAKNVTNREHLFYSSLFFFLSTNKFLQKHVISSQHFNEQNSVKEETQEDLFREKVNAQTSATHQKKLPRKDLQ